MDLYHGWFNLKPSVGDAEFARHFDSYMGHLKERGLVSSWRLTRRKLGLGPAFLPEFHMGTSKNRPAGDLQATCWPC